MQNINNGDVHWSWTSIKVNQIHGTTEEMARGPIQGKQEEEKYLVVLFDLTYTHNRSDKQTTTLAENNDPTPTLIVDLHKLNGWLTSD